MKTLSQIASVMFWGAALSLAARAEDVRALQQLQKAFEAVAAEASRSVVVVNVTSKRPAVEWREEESEEWNFEWPFDRWFGPDRRFRIPRPPSPLPQPREEQGQGSGFILRTDGYILTNHHVIENADKIEVRLQNGKKLAAVVQGSDALTDIAVLKVDAADLPAAKLGDSDRVRVGQWAIAIGAPFHLEYSVTVGVISAKSRVVPGLARLTHRDFLQTDASINPGNSGGPLVNIEGEVIGVNTAIRGINTGIGFAIPINLARSVADQLIATGKVTRGWLGIEIVTLTDAEDARGLIEEPEEGVLVRTVQPDTPADKAGLQPMDVISAVDGRKVSTSAELQRMVQQRSPGETVRLEVWRRGKKRDVKVTLGEIPTGWAAARPPPAPTAATLGLRVQEFAKADAEKFGVKGLEGVQVSAVDPSGPAARIGIAPNDVITEVDGRPIRSVADFEAAAARADLKRGVEIHFTKAGSRARTVGIIRQTAD